MVESRELQRWFAEHIKEKNRPYFLDKYQAKVIADEHKNTIVTARAGSGKTRTLVAKIIYLIAYKQIPPDKIITFAFNRKARAEINERLSKITYDNKPIISGTSQIASTFHAFSYQLLGGKKEIGNKLISEEQQAKVISGIIKNIKIPENLFGSEYTKLKEVAIQFITRAEQQFFQDYNKLLDAINRKTKEIAKDHTTTQQIRTTYRKQMILYNVFLKYQGRLKSQGLVNYNQMVANAASLISANDSNIPKYQYILVDEYQDFSLLFLNLILALRSVCPDARLLCVGDDWQAINRFAGSNVEYFHNFNKYFPEDNVKLFIPSNYRSGKLIVKNANYFMAKALKDYSGCKTGNRQKSNIYIKNIASNLISHSKLPISIENYLQASLDIIKHNPEKTIMILDRNNNLNISDWTLKRFVDLLKQAATKNHIIDKARADALISYSTIHRSKGLESDIVILLEIDAEKFPSKDKTNGLYDIFGDTTKSLFQDEVRLFYVAITRPKEKLYILSKTTNIIRNRKAPDKSKYNFFSYLNDNWLTNF